MSIKFLLLALNSVHDDSERIGLQRDNLIPAETALCSHACLGHQNFHP